MENCFESSAWWVPLIVGILVGYAAPLIVRKYFPSFDPAFGKIKKELEEAKSKLKNYVG